MRIHPLAPLGALLLSSVAAAQCTPEVLANPSPTLLAAFGRHLEIDGPTLVAAGFKPRLAIYQRHGGAWNLQQILGVPNSLGDITLEGDTLFVGDPWDDAKGEDAGAVHEYRRVGGQWGHWKKHHPFDPQPGDRFGAAVALDGDYLMVGATGRNGGEGAILPLRKFGNSWQGFGEVAPPVPSTTFGGILGLSGNHLIAVSTGNPFIGDWVHFYEIDSQQVLPRETIHHDPGLSAGQVAIDDGLAVFAGIGEVFAYHRLNGVWTFVQTLPASKGTVTGEVALRSRELLVGRPDLFNDFAHGDAAGGAQAHAWDGQSWVLTHHLASSDLEPEECLGYGAAIGDVGFVLGAKGTDIPGLMDVGSVWTFTRGTPNAMISCPAPEHSQGESAQLELQGVLDLAAGAFGFGVDDAIPSTVALPVVGGIAPPSPFGDGELCISNPTRLAPFVIGLSGDRITQVDLAVAPWLQPGTTWAFQVIYRDPGGVAKWNTTNALVVTFCP